MGRKFLTRLFEDKQPRCLSAPDVPCLWGLCHKQDLKPGCRGKQVCNQALREHFHRTFSGNLGIKPSRLVTQEQVSSKKYYSPWPQLGLKMHKLPHKHIHLGAIWVVKWQISFSYIRGPNERSSVKESHVSYLQLCFKINELLT